MRKEVRIILIVLLLGIFCVFGIRALVIGKRYRDSREVYQDAASSFTGAVTQPSSAVPSAGDVPSSAPAGSPASGGSETDRVPIKVDFEALTRENPDIVGWIYCEDTLINYPVLFGRDNAYYLDRNYREAYDPSGSIFIDGSNNSKITDSNLILYGHHMQDGSMFASLKNWFLQDYYEAHPIMWFLTPEQNYRVDLFAGYTTTADSWTYTIFLGPGPQLDSYLQVAKNSSAFTSDVTLDSDAKYIVLSTCAYNYDSYDEYRTVLHGKLVPVE